MKIIARLSFILSIALIIFSCNTEKKFERDEALDKKFVNYISYFTTGVISNSSSIKIVLKEDVIDASKEKDPQNLFEFDPEINGEMVWENDRTIIFTPNEKLKPNQSFIGTFMLGECTKVPDELDEFKFDFKIKNQDLSVSINGIEAYNSKDLSYQKLKGKVYTADVVDLKDLSKKVLHAKQNGKKLRIKWDEFNDDLTYRFKIDSVLRTEETEYVNFSWDASSIGSESKDELKFEIPSLKNFLVLNVYNDISTANQEIKINLSDPIDEQQDLEGLLYLKSGEDLRYEVFKNEIKLYPKTKLKNQKTFNYQ